MTKKESIAYDRQIDSIADSLLISAQKEAFEITDKVYLDIILRMRSKIDVQLESMRMRNAKKEV